MTSYLQGSYNKIPDQIRDRLVEMVVVEKSSIKEAATCLKLKYSTAKTIYKIYKKENRTFKYSSRSRNPGASKEMINKIQKAPLPSFVVRQTVNQTYVCGISRINRLKLRHPHQKRRLITSTAIIQNKEREDIISQIGTFHPTLNKGIPHHIGYAEKDSSFSASQRIQHPHMIVMGGNTTTERDQKGSFQRFSSVGRVNLNVYDQNLIGQRRDVTNYISKADLPTFDRYAPQANVVPTYVFGSTACTSPTEVRTVHLQNEGLQYGSNIQVHTLSKPHYPAQQDGQHQVTHVISAPQVVKTSGFQKIISVNPITAINQIDKNSSIASGRTYSGLTTQCDTYNNSFQNESGTLQPIWQRQVKSLELPIQQEPANMCSDGNLRIQGEQYFFQNNSNEYQGNSDSIAEYQGYVKVQGNYPFTGCKNNQHYQDDSQTNQITRTSSNMDKQIFVECERADGNLMSQGTTRVLPDQSRSNQRMQQFDKETAILDRIRAQPQSAFNVVLKQSSGSSGIKQIGMGSGCQINLTPFNGRFIPISNIQGDHNLITNDQVNQTQNSTNWVTYQQQPNFRC